MDYEKYALQQTSTRTIDSDGGIVGKSVEIVIDVDRLEIYRQAAEATGVPLRTITQSGETCSLPGGGSRILPDGEIEVEIGGDDLSDFWRKVEELRAKEE